MAPRGLILRLIILLAVAAFFFFATISHSFSVNSQHYFTWPWRWIDGWRIYPPLLLLFVPFALAQIIYLRRPRLAWMAMGIITATTFAMMVIAESAQHEPPSVWRIADVVQSRWSTGYFDEAAVLVRKNFTVRQYLSRYPTLLPHFYLHPRQKPPGLVLFEMGIIRLFGASARTALAAGLFNGLVAACSVIATFVFIGSLTANRDAAFFGASFLALCPSIVLFFPEFDICYPIATACIAVSWALALRRDDWRASVFMGLAYAVAGFITYLVGVLPVFLIGYAIVEYLRKRRRGTMRSFKHAGIAAGAFCAFYFFLWLVTGFNPIETLRACIGQENEIWKILINNYGFPPHSLPGTAFTDLYDFALGSGWISFVLVIFYFASARRGWEYSTRIAFVGVLQFLIVAGTGVLITETARIWAFMLPMLMLPVGLELSKWKPGARLIVYLALLLLTAAICQSMEFIGSAM